MSEATAQLTHTIEKPVVIEDHLNGIRQGVSENAGLALGTAAPNVTPIKEQSVNLPEYFKDPSTHVTDVGTSKKVPGSFESSNWLDQMRHKIPEELDQLTNPDDPQSPPPVVHGVEPLNVLVKQKAEDKMKHDTNPKPEKKGPLEAFDDWIHR